MAFRKEMIGAFAIRIGNGSGSPSSYYHMKCYTNTRRDINRNNITIIGKGEFKTHCSDCGYDLNLDPKPFIKYSKCQKKDCINKYTDGKRCAIFFLTNADHYTYCNYKTGRIRYD